MVCNNCHIREGRGLLSPVASRVVPTLGKRADQRKKDRRKQYSGRRIQKQADGQADSQPCRHLRLKEREGMTNVSFREVSHDRRDWIKFSSAIFTCTTELSTI